MLKAEPNNKCYIMLYFQLRPMFGDQGYLDDQHILIAVKGASDDHETFGMFILKSFNS